MNLYRTFSWCWGDEDFTVVCSAEGVYWSADWGYYPGKASQPACHQTLAVFLRDGVPEGYTSLPDELLATLREAIRQGR